MLDSLTAPVDAGCDEACRRKIERSGSEGRCDFDGLRPLGDIRDLDAFLFALDRSGKDIYRE
jgi:hypothetical protein